MARRPARLVGLLACAVLLVALLRLGIWPAVTGPPGDFANYYVAGRLLLEGQLGDPGLDDWEPLNRRASLYVDRLVWSSAPLATTGLVGAVFAWLDFDTARLALLLVNLACLPLAMIALRGAARLEGWVVALLVLGCAQPVWSNLREGQVYLPILTATAAGVWALRAGRDGLAGALIGWSAPVKYVTAPLLVWLGVVGRWRSVAWAAAIIVAIGLVLALAVGGPARLVELAVVFGTTVLPAHLDGRIQDPFTTSFQSFGSLLRRWLVADPGLNPSPLADWPWLRAGLRAGLGVAIVGLAAASAWRRGAARGERDAQGAGLLVFAGVLAGSAMATYHLVLLVLPVALVLGWRWRRDGRPDLVVVGLFTALCLPPFGGLYRLDDGGAGTIAAYARLWVMAALFVALIDWRDLGWRLSAVVACLGLAAALVAGGLASARPPDDGARFLAAPGLIVADYAIADGLVYVLRDTPAGFRWFIHDAALVGPVPPRRTTSLDGRYELATEQTGPAASAVVLVDRASGARQRLTAGTARDDLPSWSDGDREVVFRSDRGRGIYAGTLFAVGGSPR